MATKNAENPEKALFMLFVFSVLFVAKFLAFYLGDCVTFLLDTDILSHLQRGNPRLVERIKQVEAGDFGITIVTRIEMVRGRFDYFFKAEFLDGLNE